MTNLIQTLNSKNKYIIYYDADVFNSDVTLSIHITVPNSSNATGHVNFTGSSSEEWNTIYNEQFGTSGTAGALNFYQYDQNGIPQYIIQTLPEIAVQIWSLPPFTQVVGPSSVTLNSMHDYNIEPNYDPGDIYTYFWRIRNADGSHTPATPMEGTNGHDDGKAIINGSNTMKTVNLSFVKNGLVTLECVISAPSGCPRIVRKQINIELPLSKMLIVRNRLV